MIMQLNITFMEKRRDKKKINEVDELLAKRTTLVRKLKVENEEDIEKLEKELEEVEQNISNLSAKDNRDKIVENFAKLSNTDGSTNANGVWAVNRKVFPKNTETLPFAKKNDKEF